MTIITKEYILKPTTIYEVLARVKQILLIYILNVVLT